ncbi:MAG TPA: undecaprenyl-diphosphate phosphatase [Candidatus Paceibacterota bacterium]|nr:undecaprenyl-diphosphate phosphatase [Candidatus Paceibacterota bacterium]
MIIKTLILGIVEGLTEFIPVSSTAHLLVAGRVLGLPQGQFLDAFSICIQSGAIVAAVWYFWPLVMKNLHLIGKVVVGFIPTGVLGLVLYPVIKSFFDSSAIIGVALIVGGIGLLLIRPINRTTELKSVTYKQAFWIGLMQVGSFIPGISRSGATLIGGSLLGIPRETIVPFSFLLAVPTILGASVVEIRHVSGLSTLQWGLIACGSLVAFVTALVTIKFFIRVLTKKPLSWFGWYRIAAGILILLFI